MADSILRLRVQSDEYDNKLKRAVEGIQRLASKIHDSQGEFVGLENEQKEFIKNLQYMNTVSQTATGKVKELETAYKGLQTMYNGFNAFEKNSEEGKILAQQLSILKEKTLQARKEMEDANKSLSSTGGFLDQLTSKFTVNIDALKLFDIGMKAAGAALDVAKDAFFASESTVDEWSRVMDSSKSLYEGFLTALNTGDISGYLSRIDSIVQAARIAYNELDRLGTMKTIQAPQMSAQQTENERMRMMIQTGRYIAPFDGRKASMQNGQLLTPDQIKRIEQQLQNGMQKVVTLVGNEVTQTSRAIDAVYNRQAQELGMSLKEFRKGTSSMAEFDKRMAGYDQYQKWRAAHTTIDQQSGREIVARGNPFAQYAKWGTFRVDGDRYNQLVQLIQQRGQQAGQAYSMQSQAYRTMNRAEGITLRQLMGGGAGGSGGGRINSQTSKTEEQLLNENIQKLTQEYLKASQERQAAIRDEIKGLQDQLAVIQQLKDEATGKRAIPGGMSIVGTEGFNGFTNDTAILEQAKTVVLDTITPFDQFTQHIEYLKGILNDPPSIEVYKLARKELEKTELAFKEFKGEKTETVDKNGIEGFAGDFAKITGSVSNIASGLQALGVEIPEGMAKTIGVIQTISGILTAILAITTAIQATSSVSATASVIDAIVPFAKGGMIRAANGYYVPGTRFSGDTTPILANAGELVLNKSSQGNLAAMISNAESLVGMIDRYQNSFLGRTQYGNEGVNFSGGAMSNLNLSATVSGEQIRLVLNNNGRRTGRGEYVTTNFQHG